MSGDADDGRLDPDDAFSVLGNETRMGILRELGRADGPVAFSALYDRLDVSDSGGFNYHLDRMVGHFVEQGADGYRLAPPGRRVVEAVLSGAVTDQPDLPRTGTDTGCQYCGEPVDVRWERGGVEVFCSACEGRYGRLYREGGGGGEPVEGYLGRYPLPPAGVEGRDPDDLLGAAWTWGNLEILALSSGLCPRCAARVEWDATVCDSHAPGAGFCSTCDRRYAVGVRVACTNCILATGGDPVVRLAATTALLSLLASNGYNPVQPEQPSAVERVHGDYEETVHSTDPLRATYTFAVDGESLSLTLDEDLQVVDRRHESAD
jgi:hypothetical protein